MSVRCFAAVIIFTDDQGYADVGAFGAQGFTTPNLDRMAKEGRRFTDSRRWSGDSGRSCALLSKIR